MDKCIKNPKDVVLAVDIGGSKYMVGIIDRLGNIIINNCYSWKKNSAKDVISNILYAINEAINKNPEYDFLGIGMTIPGLVDIPSGLWLTSSKLKINHLPIVQFVSERFDLSVFIDNDARACALAEKYFGTCRDCDHFLYITISTGVGGAFVINGKVYYGGYGNAGEIGQCVVVEDGRIAENGRKGILEGYASTSGLVLNYLEAGGLKTIDGKELNGKLISDLAAKGDSAALRAFEMQGYYLGKVISSAINMLNLERVIIGGGLSLAHRYFMPKLKEIVKRDYYSKNNPIIIEPTILGYNGALLGAAAIAFEKLEEKI